VWRRHPAPTVIDVPERVSDPSPRRTVDVVLVATWVGQLLRNLDGLARSYRPGGPVDARTRERVILAVTEVNGCRYSAWIHRSWADYLGDGIDDPSEDEEVLLAYARACAEAGVPLDPAPLHEVLPPDAVNAVRATVAQIEMSNLVGNTVDDLLARVARKRPLDPLRAIGEVAAVAAALPVAVPLLATGAVMRVLSRLAPAMPEVDAPPDDDANLLVHLLAQTVPAYLANAGVRLAVLGLPVPVAIGIRAGRTAATVHVGRGQVAVANGIGPDTVLVLEGEIDPLLQLATGSLVRELRSVRLRRD
jgi:AhpD family alkylhydroperoxidase